MDTSDICNVLHFAKNQSYISLMTITVMCPKRFATTAFGINRTGSGDSSLERSHILPFMQSILLIIATSGA